MKKLLTMTAIAASVTICGSSDIVVTSEVGEKLIVEQDTIINNANFIIAQSIENS